MWVLGTKTRQQLLWIWKALKILHTGPLKVVYTEPHTFHVMNNKNSTRFDVQSETPTTSPNTDVSVLKKPESVFNLCPVLCPGCRDQLPPPERKRPADSAGQDQQDGCQRRRTAVTHRHPDLWRAERVGWGPPRAHERCGARKQTLQCQQSIATITNLCKYFL